MSSSPAHQTVKRVALVGNPNTGKSSLFNRLTGATERVGNYPGVTVERKTGWCTGPNNNRFQVIDLPGCYSMTARAPDEEVAHRELMGLYDTDACDAVIAVVDASNLARNLYLTLQILEYKRPTVVALNMIDVAESEGNQVDVQVLKEMLGVPVVPIAANSGWGIPALIEQMESLQATNQPSPIPFLSSGDQSIVDRVTTVLDELEGNACVGRTLWLLTSNEQRLNDVRENVHALITKEREEFETQAQSQPEHTLPFRQRIIVTRYVQIDRIVDKAVKHTKFPQKTRTERMDSILIHPFWGLLIFACTMFLMFQLVFAWADPFIGWVESGMEALRQGLHNVFAAGPLREFLIEGVLAGIGNILVFLPQIILLFTAITLLEDSGYMARAAFLIDGVMRRVGLHGKAFLPLMSSFACAIPGVMATRSIGEKRSRLTTIFIAPLMSCSARLPVYVLVIGAVFSNTEPIWGLFSVGGLIITAMYLLGMVTAFFVAFLLKKTVLRGSVPPLVLELPSYKRPSIRTVIRTVLRKARVFVMATGRVILALSIILWAAMTYPKSEYTDTQRQQKVVELSKTMSPDEAQEELEYAESQYSLENSWAGQAGHWIEPVIKPLGFDWKIGIGLIGSFAAREVLVSTLGQVYGVGGEEDEESIALRKRLLAEKDPTTGESTFTPLVGLSLMVFFVIAMQCLSTVAVIRRETNSWAWPIASIISLNLLAWLASFATYQIGLMVTG